MFLPAAPFHGHFQLPAPLERHVAADIGIHKHCLNARDIYRICISNRGRLQISAIAASPAHRKPIKLLAAFPRRYLPRRWSVGNAARDATRVSTQMDQSEVKISETKQRLGPLSGAFGGLIAPAGVRLKKGKSGGLTSRGHLNIQRETEGQRRGENLRIEEQRRGTRNREVGGERERRDGLHIKWTRNEAGYVGRVGEGACVGAPLRQEFASPFCSFYVSFT